MIYLFILMIRLTFWGIAAMLVLAFYLMVAIVYVTGILLIGIVALICLIIDAVRKRQGRKAIERAAATERLAAWNAKLKKMDLREARKRSIA
jgi:hypothetical protein